MLFAAGTRPLARRVQSGGRPTGANVRPPAMLLAVIRFGLVCAGLDDVTTVPGRLRPRLPFFCPQFPASARGRGRCVVLAQAAGAGGDAGGDCGAHSIAHGKQQWNTQALCTTRCSALAAAHVKKQSEPGTHGSRKQQTKSRAWINNKKAPGRLALRSLNASERLRRRAYLADGSTWCLPPPRPARRDRGPEGARACAGSEELLLPPSTPTRRPGACRDVPKHLANTCTARPGLATNRDTERARARRREEGSEEPP